MRDFFAKMVKLTNSLVEPRPINSDILSRLQYQVIKSI
jgi:hypothetical protein